MDINEIKYPSNYEQVLFIPILFPLPETQNRRFSGRGLRRPGRRLRMGQDDSYAWNRMTVMHGTGRQLWLEYVRECQIFLLQYKPPQHSCTSGPANFFALQISLITFKLQGDPPKKKKKKEAYMYVGKKESKSLKGTPSLEEGLGKNNFMKLNLCFGY